MKLTQKDKMLLIVLVILMIGAGVFFLVVKPLMAAQTLLEDELTALQTEWETNSTPIIAQFSYNEGAASQVWESGGANIADVMENNPYYTLNRSISAKQLEAASLADSSIISSQSGFSLFAYMWDEHFDGYITFNDFPSMTIVDTEYSISEGVAADAEVPIYNISTCRMIINDFMFADLADFYAMIDKMEDCSYIVIESVNVDPIGKTGSIELLILMTPGDLSEYQAS